MRKLTLLTKTLVMPYLLIGCMQYRTTPVAPGQMVLFENDRMIFLHEGGSTQRLLNIKVQGNEISCIRMNDMTALNRKGAQTHLYLAPGDTVRTDSVGRTIIPFNSIDRVEIKDLDVGLTIVYSLLGAAATAGLVFLIILLTKESCPFIYTYNGADYDFVGEIYAGSIYPPLERHDYLILPDIEAVNDNYQIRMTNEVKEIQHTNLSELIVMDHVQAVTAMVDRHGIPHTIANPIRPTEAINLWGKDVSDLLDEKDDQIYMASETLEMQTKDGVILTFNKPADTDQGKLVLKAKNSFWLDYAFGQLAREIGTRYPHWKEGQSQKTSKEIWQNSLANGVPLSVSIETENGWEFVDYYTVVGPLAFKDDVMSIDLSEVSGDQVRLKLDYGYLFWELDYVAMDFSPDLLIDAKRIALNSAVTNENTDVRDLLLGDDDKYYDQPNIGDAVTLKFKAPQKPENLDRTVVLHSKGHYEVLHESEKTPDLMALKQYKHDGGFLEFSRDRLKTTIGK